MTASVFFLVMLGTGVVSANVMKVVEWLDTPRPDRRGRRAAAR